MTSLPVRQRAGTFLCDSGGRLFDRWDSIVPAPARLPPLRTVASRRPFAMVNRNLLRQFDLPEDELSRNWTPPSTRRRRLAAGGGAGVPR